MVGKVAGCSSSTLILLLILSLFGGQVEGQCTNSCPNTPGCDHLHDRNAGYCASTYYVLVSQRLSRYTTQNYRESYSTSCGFLGWERCKRYRGKTRSNLVYYASYESSPRCFQRCCSGYQGTAPNNCNPVCNPSCAIGGNCTAPNTCSCMPQWTGATCSSDVNECAENIDGCDVNSECQNSEGSYSCSCHSGYILSTTSKTTCMPIIVSDPVSMLTYSILSDTSVNINWREPRQSNGNIFGYTVRIGVFQGSIILVEENTTSLQYMIGNLARYTPYEVTVFAQTYAGKGKPSSIIFFSMQGVPETPLDSIEIDQIDDGAILVKWKGLSLGEARGFPYYIASYASDDGHNKGRINTTNTSVLFEGLDGKLGYTFTVQIATGSGNGLATAKYFKSRTAESSGAVQSESLGIYSVVGALLGGVLLGGIAVLLLIGIVFGMCKLKKKCQSESINDDKESDEQQNTYEEIAMKPAVEHDSNFILMQKNMAYDSTDFTT